jgi:hypothetical protein
VFDERSRPDIERFLLKYYGVMDRPMATMDILVMLKSDYLKYSATFPMCCRL